MDNNDLEQTNSTTPNSGKEIRWEVVANTPGITPAQIIVGRLQAEGIPARAWQEAAGQAYGFTVGLLGTGHVSVPEEFVEKALNILESEEDTDLDDVEFDEGDF